SSAPSGSILQISGTCVGRFHVLSGKTLTLNGTATLDGGPCFLLGFLNLCPLTPVLKVGSLAVVTLYRITVQHGHNGLNFGPGSGLGGGIYNLGTLTLKSSWVTGNTARW